MEFFGVILVTVIVVSIVLSGIAHKRHKAQELIRLQTKRAKKSAAEIQTIFENIAPIGCDKNLYEILGKSWIEFLVLAKKHSPDDPEVPVSLRHAEKLITDTLTGQIEIKPALSDGKIQSYQRAVTNTLTHMKKLTSQNRLSTSDLDDWSLYLKKKYVEVEVDAHIAQAERCLSNDDKAGASTHFRVAQNKLIQSKVHGDDKATRIAEIGRMADSIYANGVSEPANTESFDSPPNQASNGG